MVNLKKTSNLIIIVGILQGNRRVSFSHSAVKINDIQKGAAPNDAFKIQESTTVENSGKQESMETKNWAQEKPMLEATGIQPVNAYDDGKTSTQTANVETAQYNNLQQPVGRPKEVYPENSMPQPHPSMPFVKFPEKGTLIIT